MKMDLRVFGIILVVLMLVLLPVATYAQTSLDGSSSGKLGDRINVTGTSGALTSIDASRFGYRRGPFITLGLGASRFVTGDDELPIWPQLSLRLGYGVNEHRLYYVKFAGVAGAGLGLGYMSFPRNYEKFYTFGSIATAIGPVGTSDENEQYSSGIPLVGEPSLGITGGIGYQWMRHSTIEFHLTCDYYFEDNMLGLEDNILLSVSIVLRGFLW